MRWHNGSNDEIHDMFPDQSTNEIIMESFALRKRLTEKERHISELTSLVRSNAQRDTSNLTEGIDTSATASKSMSSYSFRDVFCAFNLLSASITFSNFISLVFNSPTCKTKKTWLT